MSRLNNQLRDTARFLNALKVNKADTLLVLNKDLQGRDFETRKKFEVTFKFFSFYE